MDESKKNTNVWDADMYDNVLDGVASFVGIFAGVVCRYATTVIAPANDTLMKRVFRETGSIALSSAVMGITSASVKTIGTYIKPYIVKK